MADFVSMEVDGFWESFSLYILLPFPLVILPWLRRMRIPWECFDVDSFVIAELLRPIGVFR